MSIQQDRLTFFGVLLAVVVVVIGYLQLGGVYPTSGRADSTGEDAAQPVQADQQDQDEAAEDPAEGEDASVREDLAQ